MYSLPLPQHFRIAARGNGANKTSQSQEEEGDEREERGDFIHFLMWLPGDT